MHGGMSWMARDVERREDLERSVPGAKSVVAVSMSYFRPEAESEEPGELKVARYARGRDYHGWLKKRLRKLRSRLLELDPGCQVYPTLDTSPVLERAWAARAGIAWIGKSTMAIHPRLGTYTFLGTLVTTSELVPSEPLPDRCGSCTACLDACPTSAFPEPRVLDARRCISHWTLESPEAEMPRDLELRGWVAGCDICQEVCPWNRFARTAEAAQTEPKEGLVRLDPLLWTKEEEDAALSELVDRSAIARTGTAQLRRNARRALSEGRGERRGRDEPGSDA